MRSIWLTALLFAGAWGAEYRVVPGESNAYYRAETSLLLIGGDEIVGLNTAVSGWVAEGFDGGEILLQSARFDSDNTVRDGHIREILETDRYPTVRFQVHALRGIDERENGEGNFEGILQVKELPKTVVFPVRWTREGGHLIVQGKTAVAYADFGIEPPSLGWGIVKQAADTVEIGARIVLAPDGEAE